MSLDHVDQKAHHWSAALKEKKVAMEALLQAQKSLEEVEEDISEYLSKESIEGAHAQFLSTLNPSNPDASYLLTVGQAFVHPLTSCLKSYHIQPVQQPLHTVGMVL